MKVNMNRGHRFAPVAEINMVPLIDVALVLLIIFMVITPSLVATQIKINLPKAVHSSQAESEPLRIIINSRKTFYLDGKAIHPERIAESLKDYLAQDPSRAVLIEADASVDFQSIVTAMDQTKKAGAQKMGVAVAPK